MKRHHLSGERRNGPLVAIHACGERNSRRHARITHRGNVNERCPGEIHPNAESTHSPPGKIHPIPDRIHSPPGEVRPIHGTHSLSSRRGSPHPWNAFTLLQVRFTPPRIAFSPLQARVTSSKERFHSPPGEIHPIHGTHSRVSRRDSPHRGVHSSVHGTHSCDRGVDECDPAPNGAVPGTRCLVSGVDRRVPQASVSSSRADEPANATGVSPRGAAGRVPEANQRGALLPRFRPAEGRGHPRHLRGMGAGEILQLAPQDLPDRHPLPAGQGV
ncbi:MAG: hypothetical protein JWN02_381 [Acidobacteria bacterium]|nr:hypothetical protein [Acidobacteriota bacterium]